MRRDTLGGIADLRSLWLDEEFEFARITRIISMHYLKRRGLEHVLKSRRYKNVIGNIK